ncbi:MAG: VWA domain-containing protein [Pyrinomonadaceae bacterium]
MNTGLTSFDPISGEVDTASEQFETVSTGAGDRMPKDIDKETAQYRNSLFATGTIGALSYVMRGMLTLPGRKWIMMMSDGFRLFSYDPSGSIGPTTTYYAVKKLIEDANRSSVVIYTIDARGLQTLGFTAADSPNTISETGSNALLAERRDDFKSTQEGLIHIAKETGGFAVINNNDIPGGLKKMMDDQSYYMLGYVLDSDDDPEKERANKLTVKVKREGAVVRYRSAFYGIRDGQAGVPLRVNRYDQIYEAIASPFSAKGIETRLNTLFAYNDKDKSFIRSFIHVNAKELDFKQGPDGKYNAVIRIMAISFGDNGIPADRQDITATLQIPADKYQGILDTGYVYGFSFPVKKPGAYQMRVAIRDEVNGKVGSANQFIEVPDLKKAQLTLSGVVLENISSQSQTSQSPQDTSRRDLAMGDTSLRKFKRGTALGYGIEVYSTQLAKEKRSDIKMYIRIFRNGKLLLKGEPKQLEVTDPKRAPFSGGISIGDQMEPGDYILQIVAEEANSKGKPRIATQSVQFEVY